MKKKQTISIGIALAFSITTTTIKPVLANPIAVPACKNIPSCILIGTVIVGEVMYYVIKNTVTGVTRRVPAKNVPPSHRSTQSNDYESAPVGRIINEGVVRNQEECNKRARRLTEEGFGSWEALPIERTESNTQPTDDSGRIDATPEFTPLYICKVKRVR